MPKPTLREGLALLREPGFARLFAARLVSAFGSAMAPIALPFAVLEDLGGEPSDVGLVIAAGSGAQVLVVRPGFVRSHMTEGMEPAPFATTPDVVGRAVADGLRSGKRTIWVPGVLRYVFMVLRHLPGAVFRRLPLG